MKTLILRGIVFSGKGEGARYVGLSWVRKQITEKLGFTPYIGTLNLRLQDGPEPRKRLENAKSTETTPAKGFFRGKLYKASLKAGLQCAIVIPEVPDYPPDIVEIVAPENLREKLQLKDGDIVTVTVVL